jgi:hypothetical protein
MKEAFDLFSTTEEMNTAINKAKSDLTTNLTIKQATSSDLGGIKIGYTNTDTHYQPVVLDNTGKAYVYVVSTLELGTTAGTAYDGKSGADLANQVSNHIANKSNPHGVTKAQVGLDNVDNVKQIPATQKGAKNGVASLDTDGIVPLSQLPAAMPASDVSAWAKASTKPTYTKAEVGLGNVDNVKQIPYTEKGAAGGVASLGSDGKVPASQLPSYVDDVEEFDNLASFPESGEEGKIYTAKDTNKIYRWSGTTYIVISDTIALGETSSTAYAGDKGKALATQLASHVANTSNPHGVTKAQVGLDKVVNLDQSKAIKSISRSDLEFTVTHLDGTTDTFTQKDTTYAVATSTTDGLMSKADRAKLDGIEAGAQVNPKSLPASDVYDWAKAKTKPTYTKAEVGLGNVDNTADKDKSVKHATSADSVAWTGVTGKPDLFTFVTKKVGNTQFTKCLLTDAEMTAISALDGAPTQVTNLMSTSNCSAEQITAGFLSEWNSLYTEEDPIPLAQPKWMFPSDDGNSLNIATIGGIFA